VRGTRLRPVPLWTQCWEVLRKESQAPVTQLRRDHMQPRLRTLPCCEPLVLLRASQGVCLFAGAHTGPGAVRAAALCCGRGGRRADPSVSHAAAHSGQRPAVWAKAGTPRRCLYPAALLSPACLACYVSYFLKLFSMFVRRPAPLQLLLSLEPILAGPYVWPLSSIACYAGTAQLVLRIGLAGQLSNGAGLTSSAACRRARRSSSPPPASRPAPHSTRRAASAGRWPSVSSRRRCARCCALATCPHHSMWRTASVCTLANAGPFTCVPLRLAVAGC